MNRITIFADIIPEKTLAKDLGTKSEAMGFQLDVVMDFIREISLKRCNLMREV